MQIDQRPAFRGSRGFTLVEILIVVGVIVVLVAILIPGIEIAMSRAQLTKCASNLRQLGGGVMSYATSNTGLLPPVSSKAPNDLPDKYALRWFAQEENATDVQVWNLGFLWYGNNRAKTHKTGEYIAEGQVYFCPAQAHEDLTYTAYSATEPFPTVAGATKLGDGEQGVRLPYFYNPIMADPSAGTPVRLFERISDLSGKHDSTADKARWSGLLALDTVEIEDTAPDPRAKFKPIAHAEDLRSNPPVGGWNALMGDISVRYVQDRPDGAGRTILKDIDEAGTDLAKLQNVYKRISGDATQ